MKFGEHLSSENARGNINTQLNWWSVRSSIYQTEDHAVVYLQYEFNSDATALRQTATSTEGHILTRDCHVSTYTVDEGFILYLKISVRRRRTKKILLSFWLKIQMWHWWNWILDELKRCSCSFGRGLHRACGSYRNVYTEVNHIQCDR